MTIDKYQLSPAWIGGRPRGLRRRLRARAARRRGHVVLIGDGRHDNSPAFQAAIDAGVPMQIHITRMPGR